MTNPYLAKLSQFFKPEQQMIFKVGERLNPQQTTQANQTVQRQIGIGAEENVGNLDRKNAILQNLLNFAIVKPASRQLASQVLGLKRGLTGEEKLGQPSTQPFTPPRIAQGILGDEPIYTPQAKEAQREAIGEKLGVPKALNVGFAPLVGLAGTALDISPLGGAGKQAGKQVLKQAGKQIAEEAGEKVIGKEFSQILRGTKGLTADDIMKTHANIKLTKDIPATDIYGNKVRILEGEKLTPYEMKGNKVLLQDGETYIVTKNQFQNIKGNSIEAMGKPFASELETLEESVRGKKFIAHLEEKWDAKASEVNKAIKDFGATDKRTAKLRQERDIMREDIDFASKTGETKYSSYTLPNGKNYKEVLIKAPFEEAKIREGLTAKYKGDLGGTPQFDILDKDNKWIGSLPAKTKEEAIKKFALGRAEGLFTSSHWDEPNVISHLRLNERTYKGKKVTFMEELQSDWAREGRSKGFATEITEDNAKQQGFSIDRAKTNMGGEAYFINNFTDPYMYRKGFPNMGFDSEAEAWNALTKKLTETSNAVPNNPLLKNWQELSIKRALKDAVDNKSDYFAWINGEQTSARYNLATHLKNAEWDKLSGGVKDINLHTQDGSRLNFQITAEGKVQGATKDVSWNGKKLDEVLGKGLADKIMEKESGTLAGEGLKFGGEWADNLYNKQVKNIVEDLTGQKVEMLDMGLPIEKAIKEWRVVKIGKAPHTFENLTPQNIKIGTEVHSTIGSGNSYIITDVLGDGKFKAVPKEVYELIKKNPKNPLNNQLITSKSETFDISQKTTTQQGIRLTPEIKAKIRGEALKIKTSGKMFERTLPK